MKRVTLNISKGKPKPGDRSNKIADAGILNNRLLIECYINNNLNAELAVFSACNTGYGQVERGEGVMSLAQAFFYTGTKSVVMSLWPANDRSTAEIMDHFYSRLSDGESKSMALRNAKLDYIKNSDNIKSHPFYWAQFIANGELRPLSKESSYSEYLVLVAIGILVIMLVRRRSKVRHS